MKTSRAVRIGSFSARIDLGGAVVTVAALLLAVAVGAFSLTIGDYEIPFGQVLNTLAGHGSLIMTDVVVNTDATPKPMAIIGATSQAYDVAPVM